MVLDVLEHLKTEDDTLTFRRSCREGVCGADDRNINGDNRQACTTQGHDMPSPPPDPVHDPLPGLPDNGVNRLACTTRAHDMLSRSRDLVVRPLTGMPVIRDLIVDLSQFQDNLERVRPWLINHQPAPAIERLQTPEERARPDGLYECILCACCTSGCPSWWWQPKHFVGPAGLLWAARFLDDSRDTATDQDRK